MSKVSAIDLGLLRFRLSLAITAEPALIEGSAFLLAIGALLLSATPENPAERGLWTGLWDLQSREEGIADPDALLAFFGSVTPEDAR